MGEPASLRIYGFPRDAVFGGELVAAVERMELGREAALLDALFVTRDAASGALAAVDLRTGRADGTFASLLDFRLDPARRRALTERTLAEHPGGLPRPSIEALGATLEAGAALLALLHTGGGAAVLEDAVARCRGRLIAGEPVAARTLAEVAAEVRAAVTRSQPA